jgi:hypothetical protein
MLRNENISDTRIRHYSDAGMKIRQIETGRVYDEAVDVAPCKYSYEETDIETELTIDYKALLDIVTGGDGE